MNADLAHYVERFSKLRTDSGKDKYPERTQHKAPHKPLLLLSVLDLAAQGSLTTNFIPVSPELGDLFATYWTLTMQVDRAGNWSLPFFHLKSEGFWHLVPQTGKQEALAAIRQIAGMGQLRETVIGAQLDEALYQLVCAEESRNTLRTVLLEKYFQPELRDTLIEQAGVNQAAYQYSQDLLQKVITSTDTASFAPQPEQLAAVRDQGFRKAIVKAYDHRCVLCGIRLVTLDGLTAATAAHIIPWSVSYNDDPRNGLCLCRLCHWAFDVGLATITTRYRVRLSQQMSSAGNIAGYLSTLDTRPIFEPQETLFNPDAHALSWHLANVFLS